MSNLNLSVYNSSFKTIRDVAVLDAVEPFRQMIPHIIRHSNILTHDIPDNPLITTLCKDIPHQTNGGDCGIFVIKFAEYIAENKIKEMPKNFDTKVARLNMATQLYKFACEKPYLNISS
ncbi:sentrin-specific protease 6-like [Abeliophyllum distichum]|uniref:Sentrin-specific protease 6-like n=1 Tax=Abeliophyllum distichum TaxID=126358 RepID=A0ABD1U0A4_9LAMI